MGRRLAAAVVVTAVLAPGAGARVLRCAGSRYALPVDAPLGAGSVIAVDARGGVTIPGTCDGVARAVERQVRGGTRIRVRWRRCLAFGAVRLVGVIADGCAALRGTMRVGGARLPFDATLELPPPPVTTTTATTSTTTSTTATTTTSTTVAPLVGLPDDITGFERWLRMNAAPIPVHPVGDAHFGTKNVYVNQERETLAPNGVQQFPFPDGTIIVKESTRPGRDFIGLVSIMRKRAGSDPVHGDWQWIEYARSSADEAFAEDGSGQICWTCHRIREPWDWVFVRLE